MKTVSTLALLLVCMLASAAKAQTPDAFEPNNSFAAASATTNSQYSPTAIWGVLFTSPTFNDQLTLTAGDNDYFLMQTVPAGTITVYAYQSSLTPSTAALGIEVFDAAQTLLCGPASGATVYKVLRTDGSGTSGTPDPYNGVAATATIAATGDVVIRVFVQTGAIGATATMNYEWSVEFNNGTTLPDASEGAFSNNFFPVNATNATPAGVASPRTTNLTSRTYTGWDYYRINLPQSGRIQVDLSNFPTASGMNQLNYDLFWVSSTGNYGVLSFDGATDTFPPPNFNLTFPATINTAETLTTPPLAPGDYFFQVLAWIQIAPSTIGFYRTAGNYDILFTVTNVADDVYDTGANNNDTAATAATLAPGVHSNLKMYFSDSGAEEDWYKVTLANGATLEVQMTIGQPTTDDLNIELYKTSSGTPGALADRIDFTFIPNDNTTAKGGATPKEIVGTWGGVGSLGNTGHGAGDYLIRVRVGNIPSNGTYQLAVFVNGAAGATTLTPVNVAPEDAKEPNSSNAEARATNNCRINSGLNTGLKAMDGDDWYKVQNVQNNRPVEITLVYVAATDIDLDIEVYDLNTGAGALIDVNDGFLANDLTRETAGLRKVVVTATTGAAYTALGATAPATGELFIRVLRWASRGASYQINVNINNATPLTPLEMTSVVVTPPKTLDASVSGAVTINVNISNTSGTTPVDVTALTLKLTHSLGADVTTEFTITGPTPALPATIVAGGSTSFAFVVTGNPTCTNGTVIASATANAGTNRIPGDPTDSFTVTGGIAALPALAYTVIRAGTGSNLTQAGVLILEVIVNNTLGRATGVYNAPAAVDFTRGATSVNSDYIVSGAPTPTLPITVPVGQTRTVRWTYSISSTAQLGTITVTLTGGIADNPASGSGTFTLGNSLSSGTKIGGSCSTSDESGLPWALALAALLPLAALKLRRRRV